MTHREGFLRWLYHIEGRGEEMKSILATFDAMSNFVQEKTKGASTLFTLETVKEYDRIAKKWLNRRILGIYLKEKAEAFMRYEGLYRSYLTSAYFADASALEPIELAEIEEHAVEETSEAFTDHTKVVPIQTEFVEPEDGVSSAEPDNPTQQEEPTLAQPTFDEVMRSYIDTFTNTALQAAGIIAGQERELNVQSERKCAGFYYDFVNESVCVDVSEEGSRVNDLDCYAYVGDDRALKKHKSAIRDYSLDVSAYAAICGIDERAVKKEILEKAIADATEGYRAEEKNMLCLMPDILDDFQREIRRQITYNGKRLFTVPKSVALLTAVRLDGNLEEGKRYYVIDFDGDEVSVSCLETLWDEDHGEVSIIRRGLVRISPDYYSYTVFSKRYLKAYSKFHKVELSDDLINQLSKTKFLYRHFRDKGSALIADGDRYIQIDYDERLFRALQTELKQHSEAIWNELKIQQDESVYVVCSLFPNEIGCNDLFVGCREIARRLQTGEPLWKEYLPHLTLEVKSSGSFREIELIRKDEYRDVKKILNAEETISVNSGEITLTAGEPYYALPLERDVIGSQNHEKMARLESKYFPLEEDLHVRLEIHYRYGDEDSYRLRFIPLDKDTAPFAWLESEWCDSEPIACITPPEFKIRDRVDRSNLVSQMQETAEKVSATFEALRKGERLPWYVKREIIKDGRGLDQSSLFWRFNYYGNFRKTFTPSVLYIGKKKNAEVIEIFEILFAQNFFSNMLGIIRNDSVWKNVFEKKEADIVRRNALQHLSDFSLLYAQKLNPQMKQLATEIIECIVYEDKLHYLVSLSRCIGKGKDYYGIFDALNRKIVQKVETKKLDFFDLRPFSANCWEMEEWIENVYFAEKGVYVLQTLIECCFQYIEAFDFNRDILHRDYNPRFIRDVMELLLCLMRADPIHKRETGENLIDPNSPRVKQLIKKIKEIDSLMKECSAYLKHPFVSRLNIETDSQDMNSVNEISLMLVTTLSGGGNFSLISFEED